MAKNKRGERASERENSRDGYYFRHKRGRRERGGSREREEGSEREEETRELHIVTEYQTKTDTVGIEKLGNKSLVFFRCRFRSEISVEPYFLSPMIGERERDGAREGGTERERETQR